MHINIYIQPRKVNDWLNAGDQKLNQNNYSIKKIFLILSYGARNFGLLFRRVKQVSKDTRAGFSSQVQGDINICQIRMMKIGTWWFEWIFS